MNRGLTGVVDAGLYTQALNIINNSTARVAALQSAPESCAAYLDFQCNANDNVATTTRRLDTYMKASFYRLQTLVATGGGNRNGLSLVQTMTQIAKTTALTQAERNDFSESAGNFTERANATDLAQTTYAQDLADLLGALIDKNAEAAEGESAPISSNACEAVGKAFERVERLLHKAGTALTVGGGPRRLDTSMFESWSSRVDATGRGQLQPSGARLSLPQFAYRANSAASAGDIVVMVALRWKSRVDLCRKPSDLTLESDIYTVNALGDASRMADDVYFAAGETMEMTFTARTSSSRAAQRTTGCSGSKECRWWNTATQAWDPSGCAYSETTESCSCTRLGDFAVVTPVIACPESESGATSSGASSMIFVAVGAAVVVVGVIIYFVLRKRNRKKYGKVFGASSASVVPHKSVSDDSACRSERGESKIGWVDSPAAASPSSVAGMSRLFGSIEKNNEPRDAKNEVSISAHAEDAPQMLAMNSSSESEGVSDMESYVIPELKNKSPLQAKRDKRALGERNENPGLVIPTSEVQPKEEGPSRSSPRQGTDAKDSVSLAAPGASTPPELSQAGDPNPFGSDWESSNSEGISHLESYVLPDPVHEKEDFEYMRRCRSKFAQLATEHEMETAMQRYDTFLSRPRDDVLDDPDHLYPDHNAALESKQESGERPRERLVEPGNQGADSDASTSEEPGEALGSGVPQTRTAWAPDEVIAEAGAAPSSERSG